MKQVDSRKTQVNTSNMKSHVKLDKVESNEY